jgi:hypothetical protein
VKTKIKNSTSSKSKNNGENILSVNPGSKPDPFKCSLILNKWSIVDYRRDKPRTSKKLRKMVDYVTDVVFYHIHIPVFLDKIHQLSDKAKRLRSMPTMCIKNHLCVTIKTILKCMSSS